MLSPYGSGRATYRAGARAKLMGSRRAYRGPGGVGSSGKKGEAMSYPAFDNQRAMLDAINRRLKESQGRGELALDLWFHDVLNTADELSIPQAEGAAIVQRLYREEFLEGKLGQGYKQGSGASVPFSRLKVEYLTSKGMQEIGEFPDPQQRLILGFDAALRTIRQDNSISEEEKKRKIDWFEEAKFVARTLTIDAAKAVFRGDVPIF